MIAGSAGWYALQWQCQGFRGLVMPSMEEEDQEQRGSELLMAEEL